MQEKTVLLDEIGVSRTLVRLSHEMVERNKGTKNVVIVGIKTRGVNVAKAVCDNIEKIEGNRPLCGSLDITLYRDDLSEITDMPKAKSASLPFDVKDKEVILCDDVLYTGRTARAAIEAVLTLGRPRSIQLAVLIDRGHRELPIRADYVGKNIPTAQTEIVSVRFQDTDGETCVKLFDK